MKIQKILLTLLAILPVSVHGIMAETVEYTIIKNDYTKKTKERYIEAEVKYPLTVPEVKKLMNRISENPGKYDILKISLWGVSGAAGEIKRVSVADAVKKTDGIQEIDFKDIETEIKPEVPARISGSSEVSGPVGTFAILKQAKEVFLDIDYNLQISADYSIGPKWKKWVSSMHSRLNDINSLALNLPSSYEVSELTDFIELLRTYLVSVTVYIELQETYLFESVNSEREKINKTINEMERKYRR